jgi:hypothetical protein
MGDAHESRHMVDAGLGGISSVVSSLPLGYTLGERRTVSGVEYKLVFNAGNSEIQPGNVAAPILALAGVNSVTVSTSSQGNNHIGGVVNVHATAPTANYFWGATRGVVGGLIGDSASIPTGSAFAIGANGSVQLMPQSVVTGKVVVGVVLTTVSNGGAKNGNAYISMS